MHVKIVLIYNGQLYGGTPIDPCKDAEVEPVKSSCPVPGTNPPTPAVWLYDARHHGQIN